MCTIILDAVPECHHPTWEEAHQPTTDLETLFFAFDLHPQSVPRDTQYQTFPVESGQFDDADE